LDDPFAAYLQYLRDSHALVEKVYQLEKAGGFGGEGTDESRQFIRQRLAAGATMLRDLWYTAWLQSAVDPPPYTPPKPAATDAPSPTKKPENRPSPNMRTVPSFGETTPQPGA
jgi:hypothetical protein